MTGSNLVRRVFIGVSMACTVAAGLASASTPSVGTPTADRGADSLYRAGRAALVRRDYHGAADLFASIVSRHRAALVAGNAEYWLAYALYASGNATHSLRDLRGAREALDTDARRYPAVFTARRGLDLRARVVAAEATLGDLSAQGAVDAALTALTQPLSCDDGSVALKLVALERLIDRDPESAMPTVRRLLSTRGPCTEDVRRATIVIVESTPGMDATALAGDLARADRALVLVPPAPSPAGSVGSGSRAGAFTVGLDTSIPIRPLGPITAATSVPLGDIAGINALADGRVVVNDYQKLRVLLFDSSLKTFSVVLDTTGGTPRRYPGGRGGGRGYLIAYAADSTIFVDVVSTAFVVIDPQGKIARVAAPPHPADINSFASAATRATYDGLGSLVYKPPARLMLARDSTPLLRVNLATTVVDTVAMLRRPYIPPESVSCGAGCVRAVTPKIAFTLELGDDWAILPNGTVGVIRSWNYHVDWIAPNGTKTSGPRVAHEWIHLTDSAKAWLIDSMKHADSVTRVADSLTAIAGRGRGPLGRGGGVFSEPPTVFVTADQIPDYRPPFHASDATLALGDADGHIWIKAALPVTPDGGQVWDILDSKGVLVDRVQQPGGTTIVGFGGGGAVYLTSRVGTGVQLARAKFQ